MIGAASDLFVGIDIGTAETKGTVVDGDGTVIARASRPNALSTPYPGYAEHDAEAVWWQGFTEVSRKLMDDTAVEPQRIRAVGASAIGPCVLPVSSTLDPLRPGILYGVDTRATSQIAALNERLGEEDIFSRSGNYLTTQSAGPKIQWIRDNEPEIHGQAAHFMTSQSFVVARLTGNVVIDHGTAGYFHPLYDLQNKCWDLSGCEDFITVEQLPRLGWATDVAGTVTSAAAAATGIPEGTPVIVGTTDAPAEAVSSSVVTGGDMMLMYGSSTFFIQMLDQPSTNDVLWSSPYVFEDTYVLAAGTATAGTLTQWLCDVLGLDRSAGTEQMFSTLMNLARDSAPGANGLLFLPYLSGERTPLHDANARGVISGLSLNHDRGDIARAMMEGIAHSIADVLEAYDHTGHPPLRIHAVGGGTKNEIFLQSVSDITNMEQTIAVTDGAAFGDAALAAFGTGYLASREDILRWCQTGSTVAPDAVNQSRLQSDHSNFHALYRGTKEVIHSRVSGE